MSNKEDQKDNFCFETLMRFDIPNTFLELFNLAFPHGRSDDITKIYQWVIGSNSADASTSCAFKLWFFSRFSFILDEAIKDHLDLKMTDAYNRNIFMHSAESPNHGSFEALIYKCLTQRKDFVSWVDDKTAKSVSELQKDFKTWIFESRDRNGESVVMYASRNKNPRALQTILSLEVDSFDSTDDKGLNPLMHAIKAGSDACAKILIANFSYLIDMRDCYGNQALSYAISTQNAKIVKLLLDNKADRYAFNNAGQSALHIAANVSCIEIIEIIFQDLNYLNFLDKDGKTPLIIAAENNNQPAIIGLLENGADVNIKDKGGRHAYHYYTKNATFTAEIVQKLTPKD